MTTTMTTTLQWTLLLFLSAVSASAQTYVKPYSMGLGLSEKFEQKPIGPTAKTSPYSWVNNASVSINYRTIRDSIRLSLAYSRALQTRTNTVTVEVRYNLFQWGKRPSKTPDPWRLDPPSPQPRLP